jgi:hypothetical protein
MGGLGVEGSFWQHEDDIEILWESTASGLGHGN